MEAWLHAPHRACSNLPPAHLRTPRARSWLQQRVRTKGAAEPSARGANVCCGGVRESEMQRGTTIPFVLKGGMKLRRREGASPRFERRRGVRKLHRGFQG